MHQFLLILSEMRLILTQMDSVAQSVVQIGMPINDMLSNQIPDLMNRYSKLTDMVASNPYLNNTANNKTDINYRAASMRPGFGEDYILRAKNDETLSSKAIIVTKYAQFTATLLGPEMANMIFDFIRSAPEQNHVLDTAINMINMYSKENLARFMVLSFNSPVHNEHADFYLNFASLMADIFRGKIIDNNEMQNWLAAGGNTDPENIKPSERYGINWNHFKNGLDEGTIKWYQDETGFITDPLWSARMEQYFNTAIESFSPMADVVRKIGIAESEIRSPSFPFIVNKSRLEFISMLLCGISINNANI